MAQHSSQAAEHEEDEWRTPLIKGNRYGTSVKKVQGQYTERDSRQEARDIVEKQPHNRYSAYSQRGRGAMNSQRYHNANIFQQSERDIATKPHQYLTHQKGRGVINSQRYHNNSNVLQQSENHIKAHNNYRGKRFPSKMHQPYEDKVSSNIIPNNQCKESCTVGLSDLEELIKKEPNEILQTLCSPNYGFSLLLQNIGDTHDLIALTLIAVGTACRSSNRSSVIKLINLVTQNKNFLFCSLLKYLIKLSSMENQTIQLSAIDNFIEFLFCFQQSQPFSASDTLHIVMPHLDKMCEQKLCDSSTVKKIEELKTRNASLEKYSHQEVKKATHVEQVQNIQPPENYRNIPVLPDEQDIWQQFPFLRPNVTNGKYSDAEHYLDVQFRLLREDYIRPLREGIASYLKEQKHKKSLRHNRDIKVYKNVHVEKDDFVDNNLIHLVSFDVKEFKRVNWEHSKRFLTGSLLCLSADNFKTMLFASVAYRDAEKLRRGILMLKFEDLSYRDMNFNPMQDFVIIETDSYFEAYRHNLAALQDMKDETFPLRRYIVDMEAEIDRPAYLNHQKLYDMTPILQSNSEEKLIPVLHTDYWPTKEQLGLDESQYEALKAAIMNEFVIIQGPPGTGKTYVGLKIVELLLHNIQQWQPKDRSHCPILIVCYTNHALDQFLEGILKFSKSLVRVGGRSSSEALKSYQLSVLRRSKTHIRSDIFENIAHKSFELRESKDQIEKLQKEIKKSQMTVLNEDILDEYMTSEHYASLKSAYSPYGNYIIYDWLEIIARELKFYYDPEGAFNFEDINSFNDLVDIDNVAPNSLQCKAEKNPNNIQGNALLDSEEDGESEVEEDIDFIEAMREVDSKELYHHLNLDDDEEEDDELTQLEMSGWKVQGGSKQMKTNIMKRFKKNIAMTLAEARKVKNVWSLKIADRWRLYKYWVMEHIKSLQNEVMIYFQQMQNELEELTELKTEKDLYLLQNTQVIGMTTTGAAKFRHALRRLNPRIVIVEEAAEILESHIVTSLTEDTQHLILIGDHQQLKPNPTVYELAVKFKLNVSLFERMVNNGMEYKQLAVQHRMRPIIAALLVPHIYPTLSNHESVTTFEDIKGVTENMFFVTHTYSEDHVDDSKSRANSHEAGFITELCRYLLLQGYSASDITILTTYSGQLFALKNLAKDDIFKGVRITVVDNYQGEENEIILVSFVRSNFEGNIGFLKVSNRVCVALSRARKGLFCVGNIELLAEKSLVWKNIVKILNEKKAIGRFLHLRCQNHPDTYTEVSVSQDFKKVPEGGCTEPCTYRLNCGHVCIKLCHPVDPSHENVKCFKPCTKMCESGHICPRKCYEQCKSCKVLVTKVIPICSHEVSLQCHISVDSVRCPKPCPKCLPCGHICKRTCGQYCGVCIETVSVDLPCNHKIYLECHKSEYPEQFQNRCSVPCQSQLQCGHICHGTCSSCHQGKTHIKCKESCRRLPSCGHECKKLCCEQCICSKYVMKNVPVCNHPIMIKCHVTVRRSDCQKPCSQFLPCGHKCRNKCGEDCQVICRESVHVAMSCGHKIEVPCSDSSNPEKFLNICSIRCRVRLSCNHFCSGVCGKCSQGKEHILCTMPCKHVLSCGHKCKEPCSDSCKCKARKKVKLPVCNHEIFVPCSSDNFHCPLPCSKFLPCGHKCKAKCAEDCTSICKELVSKVLPCSHRNMIPCCMSFNPEKCLNNCSQPCRTRLECGHICSGTCGKCKQGQEHISCHKPACLSTSSYKEINPKLMNSNNTSMGFRRRGYSRPSRFRKKIV